MQSVSTRPYGVSTAYLLTVTSYKPDLKLRFITEELAFESDAEAAQFVIDCNGEHLLQERGDAIIFLAGNAKQLFENARSDAFRRVDLKGQI
jgi:SAC3 family protein LENG8/THP3